MSSFLLVAGSSVCDPAKAVLSTSFQVLSRTTIRLNRTQKLPQIGLSRATIGQARQAAGRNGSRFAWSLFCFGGSCWSHLVQDTGSNLSGLYGL